MAEIQKPQDINKIWAVGGDILAPSDSKIATGWQVEIPPRQYFNYIDNKQDQFNAHVNQHGIPVWDNTTEYQYSTGGTKSICMGTNGTIYRAKQLNINQNPVTDSTNTYWEVAFANASDFYTQTQSDARYLQKSANLGDLTNPATARTNLSVYSQAQTYTQTQIDAKTTVASTLQSQTQTSDTVLLSPLKLSQSLQGANQSLTAGGYQKLPGGLILQWANAAVTTNPTAFTFPTPFPTACLTLCVGAGEDTSGTTAELMNVIPGTKTRFGFSGNASAASTYAYIAIGY